jgi:hypothetical protein
MVVRLVAGTGRVALILTAAACTKRKHGTAGAAAATSPVLVFGGAFPNTRASAPQGSSAAGHHVPYQIVGSLPSADLCHRPHPAGEAGRVRPVAHKVFTCFLMKD